MQWTEDFHHSWIQDFHHFKHRDKNINNQSYTKLITNENHAICPSDGISPTTGHMDLKSSLLRMD